MPPPVKQLPDEVEEDDEEHTAAVNLRSALASFPGVQHAFAYGSAVFAQPGAEALRIGAPMVDYIFAVDDPVSWHAANLECNARHYSPLMRAAGASAVVAVADSVGTGVHFNPFARVGTQARVGGHVGACADVPAAAVARRR